MVAATTKNAADDGSPGTRARTAGAPRCTRVVTLSTTSTGAPRRRRAARCGRGWVPVRRSRWCRRPAARRAPARSSPARSPPRARGARRQRGRRRIRERREGAVVAPVDVRAHRPQRLDRPAPSGRGDSDASPVSTERNGRPAHAAGEDRIVVPELPQSTTPAGSRQRVDAAPVDHDPAVGAFTRRDAERVERRTRARRTSSPVARFASALRRRPSAANSNARCEMPLSPGTRTVPRSGDPPARTACAQLSWGGRSRNHRPRRGSRARRARPRSASAPFDRDDEHEHTARAFERVRDLEVGDVDAEPAAACVTSASTPGRSGTGRAAPRARRRRASRRAGCAEPARARSSSSSSSSRSPPATIARTRASAAR